MRSVIRPLAILSFLSPSGADGASWYHQCLVPSKRYREEIRDKGLKLRTLRVRMLRSDLLTDFFLSKEFTGRYQSMESIRRFSFYLAVLALSRRPRLPRMALFDGTKLRCCAELSTN